MAKIFTNLSPGMFVRPANEVKVFPPKVKKGRNMERENIFNKYHLKADGSVKRNKHQSLAEVLSKSADHNSNKKIRTSSLHSESDKKSMNNTLSQINQSYSLPPKNIPVYSIGDLIDVSKYQNTVGRRLSR